MNTIWIVLPILTVLMFDLGLCLKLGDFVRVIKAPKAVLLALFGQPPKDWLMFAGTGNFVLVLLQLIAMGFFRKED